MNKTEKLALRILSVIAAIVIMVSLLPYQTQAGTTYSLHAVDDLSNCDALYRDYVKSHDLTFGYITDLTSPQWQVHNSDFKTVSKGECTFLYTSPDKRPKSTGSKNATVWSDVATITYSDAGYYGSNKENKFDIIFHLEKVVSMKPDAQAGVETTEPYYTVAFTNNSDGHIDTESYIRDSDLVSASKYGSQFTIEDWNIKIVDKKGNILDKILLAQTYRDIDIAQPSNDPSYTTFNEGFCLISGYADDTYVTKDSALKVYDMYDKTNARYESGLGLYTVMEDTDQNAWVVAAIRGGQAALQWTGQNCGSRISQSVFRDYPKPEEPVKTVNADIVKTNQEIEYSVTENFPAINPSNCAKSITFTDTVDDHLTILPDIKITCDGKDVTRAWQIKTTDQKVVAVANDPGTVEGAYTFTIPASVNSESLDGKTLIVKDGATYAEIPNVAFITIKDQFDKDIDLETPTVKIYEKGASINIVKEVDKTHVDSPEEGDALKYSFAIENTGKLTLHDVELKDALQVKDLAVNWKSSTDKATGEGTLSPGEKVTASCSYLMTMDDIEAGLIKNTVTVTGKDPKDLIVKSKDKAETTLSAEPGISLSKTADPNKMTDPNPGDKISYRFIITNTGSLPLHNINFTDDHELSELEWSVGDLSQVTLPAGGTIEGHGDYSLKQNDIDAGKVLNKADVSALGSNDKAVQDHAEDTTVIDTTPSILLKKSTPESVLTGAHAGDTVRWDFLITNSGKSTLSGVYIEDHLDGVSEIAYRWNESSDTATGEGQLSPGESVPASAEYTLAQNDIMNKNIVNTATAHGTDPYGREVTSDANAKLKIKCDPSVKIEKTADITNYTGAKAGDVITYTLSLTNNGNVDLVNVELVDLKEGVSVKDYSWPTKEGFLAPGETVTATAEYVLTQDDIDVTHLDNEAEGRGQAPDGSWVTDKTPNTIPKETSPEIALVKDVDINEIESAKAGDILTYTITVTNIGDVTLHDVDLEDSLQNALYDITVERNAAVTPVEPVESIVTESEEIVGAENESKNENDEEITADSEDVTAEESSLGPNESFVMTAKYNITQEDINNGQVINTASVTAKDPEGREVAARDDAQTVLAQISSDAVTKKASAAKVASTDAKAGYEITYEFTASNTGNTTLHDVEFNDDMLNKAGSAIIWNWNTEGTLLPGETITGSSIYKLTDDDIKAGKITNIIIMNAKDPQGNPLPPAEAIAETILEKKADHTVTKTADRDIIDNAKIGDSIKYVFTYTNTGNVELYDIRFTDDKITKAGGEIEWDWSSVKNEGIGVLYPGESINGKAVYKITQADIDAGKVINTIIANAKDPDGTPLEPAKSEVSTGLSHVSKIVVKKSVDKTTLNDPAAGAMLTYSFKVTNEGTTTLSDISLADTLTGRGLSEISYNYPNDTKVLLPGQSMTASAVYKLNSSDIAAKRVENTVYAKAKDPLKKEITSDKASATTTIVVTVRPTSTPTPIPTVVQTRMSTQTVTSPKTGDRTMGIGIACVIVITGTVLLTKLIKRYRIHMR